MGTITLCLPESIEAFVDEQVACRGGTGSEYICDLICKDRERLRASLLEGAASAPAGPADTAYFDVLGARDQRRKSE